MDHAIIRVLEMKKRAKEKEKEKREKRRKPTECSHLHFLA